jgi:hypothetical protein
MPLPQPPQPWLRSTRIMCGAALLLMLALAGCETLTVSDDGFVSLDDAAAAQTLRGIARATSGWQTVKVKLACTFVMQREGDLHTETAAGICLWRPGRALRVRFSKLGMSVAEVLYNGRFWFITDEPGGTIYVCRRIERARMPGIPAVFFQQLQTMPQGWLAGLAPAAAVAESDAAIRIIDRPRGARRTLIFPKGAGMPSRVDLVADDGSAFRATLAAPNPRFVATAATFAPTLGAYAIYDLDRREWIRR